MTNQKKEKTHVVLTPSQREAVESNDRFIAVVAGPGSGKTRVLTERICHLVNDCGVNCQSILAVSFSSKAAGEMEKRLRESLGTQTVGLSVSTFHSFGLSMIRKHASLLGFKDNIEILTPTDRNRILKKIWEDQKKKCVFIDMPFPELIDGVSKYKGGLQNADRRVISLTNLYNQELKLTNCVDFDDMILLARKLLMENDDVRHVLLLGIQHPDHLQQFLLSGRKFLETAGMSAPVAVNDSKIPTQIAQLLFDCFSDQFHSLLSVF